MDTPVLLAIHAVKRAGKNTTAQFIADWAAKFDPAFTTRTRGFADNAKWAFARIFYPSIGMDEAVLWFDQIKDNDDIRVVLATQRGGGMSIMENHQVRQAMAQFSTESAREIYGGDFWVNQLLPEGDMQYDPYPNWVRSFELHLPDGPQPADIGIVHDMRFIEEVERVQDCKGLNLKIRRRDAEQAVLAEAARLGRKVHMSEMGLPDNLFDVVINNDDNDMDNARRRTYLLMDEIRRNGVESIKRGSPRPWRIA